MVKKSVKKFMKRKVWKIPIWLIIILLGVSAVGGAVMYTLTIPSTITITPPPAGQYEIKLYWDNECITEVTFFDFGEVEIGETASVTFYLKNVSNVSVDVHAFGWISAHTYAFDGWQRGIAPNDVREWTLSTPIPVMAEEGTYNFDTVFNVYPAS